MRKHSQNDVAIPTLGSDLGREGSPSRQSVSTLDIIIQQEVIGHPQPQPQLQSDNCEERNNNNNLQCLSVSPRPPPPPELIS